MAPRWPEPLFIYSFDLTGKFWYDLFICYKELAVAFSDQGAGLGAKLDKEWLEGFLSVPLIC